MEEAPYKIFNASAGSGKTYTLVKEYLKILFSSKNRWAYQRILCLTFTNKAVNEMKQRILGSLYSFSRFEEAPPAMLQDLALELGQDPETLKRRSGELLKEILHNYAFFDISTIDRFNNRLIRTFARDLKLPAHFEVLLDTDLLLDEAVARLVAKAGEDVELTPPLVDFALEKLDDDKNWDISFDLLRMGKLLFDENHAPHIAELSSKTPKDFIDLKKKLAEKISLERQLAVERASQILQTISQQGLDTADFTRKTLPNHFTKIMEGSHSLSALYGNKLEQNLEDGQVYNKSLDPAKKDTIDQLQPDLLHAYRYCKQRLTLLALYKNAYGNNNPLTVLGQIQKEIKALEEERDQLHISAFNAIISKEIKNQPAPFIYERLGEKYHHYFIDEFQDTSQVQWENLVPLISNALQSEDLRGDRGSLLLVGDIKQAIYRWRGGRAELLLHLAQLRDNPFQLPPQVTVLPKNHRSHATIVDFNNDFFCHTAQYLGNSTYQQMFVEGNQQETNAKTGGLVSFTFIEGENLTERKEAYCQEVLQTIIAVREKGYLYKDICVLVRDNRNGMLLANYLAEKEIPILSADSLLLANDAEVQFLISLLQFAQNPLDGEASYRILETLSPTPETFHSFVAAQLPRLEPFLQETYNFLFSQFKALSVYDAMEYAIKAFGLVRDTHAYLIYFLDVVMEVEKQFGPGMGAFLTYWEKKRDSLGVPAPEHMEAVQIMTVHKAKGLEFPIVIFPFANASIHNDREKKLWLPLEEPMAQFHELLLNKKQEMLDYGEKAQELYTEEEQKLELDAHNVLYVALTRAVKALFVLTEKDVDAKGLAKTGTYAGLFVDYLMTKNLWQEQQDVYTFGSLDDASATHEKQASQLHVPYAYSEKDRLQSKILTTGGMLWATERSLSINQGNQLHYAMALVNTKQDIGPAVETLIRKGLVEAEKALEIQTAMEAIVEHPELREFYQEGIWSQNETDLLIPGGTAKRPDRLAMTNGQITMIDYKTGQKSEEHKMQLQAYDRILSEMGYTVRGKILVYVDNRVETLFVD